jgi:hypothetical protein
LDFGVIFGGKKEGKKPATQPQPGDHEVSGIVQVSQSDLRAEYDSARATRETLIRRLLWRQEQKAHFGMTSDPSIILDIAAIEYQLKIIEVKIANYPEEVKIRADRTNILSVDQQREVVLALSRITGLPPEKIKLVDIVLGSVVLVVEMPVAGAARLVAMQRLNHPVLRDQGFASVALDQVADISPGTFERAVRFAQSELQHEPGNEASPYTTLDGSARLRITLANT